MAWNRIKVEGFAGKDAEHKVLASGISVASVSIAESYTPKNGEKVSTWYNIQGWNAMVEQVAKIRKGQLVLVEGRLDLKVGTDGKTYPTINASYVATLNFEKKEKDGDWKPKHKGPNKEIPAFNAQELDEIPF